MVAVAVAKKRRDDLKKKTDEVRTQQHTWVCVQTGPPRVFFFGLLFTNLKRVSQKADTHMYPNVPTSLQPDSRSL